MPKWDAAWIIACLALTVKMKLVFLAVAVRRVRPRKESVLPVSAAGAAETRLTPGLAKMESRQTGPGCRPVRRDGWIPECEVLFPLANRGARGWSDAPAPWDARLRSARPRSSS